MTTTNTKKPVEADVDAIDELAADAVPTEYPDGAPLLQPYLQIRPRSRRAEFKRKFAEFSKVQDQVNKIKESGVLSDTGDQAGRLNAWADMDDMYQQMDELLEMAAVNPEAYREWSDTADDAALGQVFSVYMKRTQPGEASSSAS